ARYRARPVDVVPVRAALFDPDSLAVLTQSRAGVARDDRVAHGFERRSVLRRARIACPRELASGRAHDPRYHTRHCAPRTIGASLLHENAFWNSGMFETTPFTR